jgi:hypothetical protein
MVSFTTGSTSSLVGAVKREQQASIELIEVGRDLCDMANSLKNGQHQITYKNGSEVNGLLPSKQTQND